MNLSQAARIGALGDPTRQALYDHVVAQPEPVSRDAAASALGIAPHVAKFQLDRLVEVGLLAPEFRRLSGRTGPGAGRPAKLYRRADETIAVSLPARRYDLVGHLLASAVERSEGLPPTRDAVRAVAHEEGQRLGAAAATTVDAADATDAPGELDRVGRVLEPQGYEPRVLGHELRLANCPFDTLAREHTDLVCGMNHAYIDGVLDGMGCTHVEARLHPAEGRCCVTVGARDDAPTTNPGSSAAGGS